MITQRLVNKLPHWTKARRDPSSLLQRYLSSYGEFYDFIEAYHKKLDIQKDLYRRGLGLGHLWSVELDGDDELKRVRNDDGTIVIDYPDTVVGSIGATDYTLTRDEFLEDLMFGPPTRLAQDTQVSVSNWLLWDSDSPTTYNDLAFDSLLTIFVSGSTVYYRPEAEVYRSGRSRVYIRGRDQNGTLIEENIEIPDDGVWLTRRVYSEIIEVIPEGYNGRTRVYLGNAGHDYESDLYRSGVTPEQEGPLRVRLLTETYSGTTKSYIEYFTTRYQFGQHYRQKNSDADNEIRIDYQLLRDKNGNDIEAVDLALDHNSLKLWAVDTAGKLHLFDHALGVFDPPENEPTTRQYIELAPIVYRWRLGQTAKINTWHRILRKPIRHVVIKYVAPDNTVKYLQSDKTTWGGAAYEFKGKKNTRLPEQSWNDFRFELLIDQVGQWDLECTVTTTDGEETTTVTSVMVDELRADETLSSGTSTPTGVWQDHRDRLVVSEAGQATSFITHRDSYLADQTNQQLLIREEYDEVEVTYV